MDINIVAGRSAEINNQYIFSLLKNRDKSKNHIIIAPDRSQFSIERRLFEETGEKCFFDINVISMSRLSKKLLVNNKKNILTKQSGVALVKKILEDNKDKLMAFGKATSFMGFASNLFETICLYKSCNIAPEQVYVDESLSLSNLKQKDIKLVYSEYEKYLQNDFTDSFNQLSLFAERIKKDSFPNTIFYFIEFDDFTRLMYNIIFKLAKFSDRIYLTCTYGKGATNSNLYSHKMYYDFIDLFKQDGLEYKIVKPESSLNNSLNVLTENVLSYNNVCKRIDCPNIDIRMFDNAKDEVKFAIADIYSKVITNKNSFSEYAIVVPGLSGYKQLLQDELSRYNIPYYVDESVCIKDNYLIRTLFQLLQIVMGDYKYFDFASLLKSPLLNFDYEQVLEYDRYLKRIGAISDMCLRDEKTDSGDIVEFIGLIRRVRESVNGSKSVSTYIEIITKCFDYMLTRSVEYEKDLKDLDKRTFEQVKNKFESINNDCLSVFSSLEMDFDKFVEIYSAYFESTNICMPPITSNTLFIADFNSSYISCIDYLYVLGNNEGKLPKYKLDNGLVTDEEISRLPNAEKLTPTIAMLNARKTFKLFELLFRFKKEFILSYPNANSEGKLYPNNFVDSIMKLTNKISTNYSGVLDVVSRNYYSIDENNIIFNNLTTRLAEENLIKYLSSWNIFCEDRNYRELVSSMYDIIGDKTKHIISRIGKLNSFDNIKKYNFFASGNTSVSEIENFNKCPYLHFVNYGLRLEETRDNSLQPIDIGNILHEVLSRVVPSIVGDEIDIENIQSIAKNNLKQVLSDEKYNEKLENVDNTYVIKSLYRELERIIIAICDEVSSSNFKPKYSEYRFDKILTCNGINVKGFIDRIDVGSDGGFLVIDYKTGDNQFKNFNDVFSGKKLQLLVYAKAFEEKTGMKAKGVFYLPISNSFSSDEGGYKFNGVLLKTDENIVNIDRNLAMSGYKSSTINLKTTSSGKIFESQYYKNLCLSQEDFDYLLQYSIRQVEQSISRIKEGEINSRPIVENGKSVCDYCRYKAICNYEGCNDKEIEDVANIEKLKELGGLDGKI